MPLRPRKAWALNALLAAGSLLAGLVLCEVVARILLPPAQVVKIEKIERPDWSKYEPKKTTEDKSIDSVVLFGGPHGVRLRPNTIGMIRHHSVSGLDVVIRVNSIGLRYDELGPKSPDEFRVLVLGDSITFGDFLPEEETWSRRMEELTRGRAKTIRFINAGLPGAGTLEEFWLFQEIKDVVKPDLVLVGMYLNDAQNASQFYVKSLGPPWGRSRFLAWVVARLQLLEKGWFRSSLPGAIDPAWREEFRAGRNLKSGDMFHTRDGFDFEIYNAFMDFGLGWNPKAWREIARILESLRSAVRGEGAALAVCLFPVHIQIYGTVGDVRPQESARAMCARLSIPFFDPLPALHADAATHHEKLLFDHCHYTAYGYGLLAKWTVAWLDAEKLIPSR
ncbi:MAG: SGNH/GDSL hydrolase family protein [Acidithiobacillales bacterium]